MLKKVAICQGFRLAFPDEMGGMPYAPEELNHLGEVTITEVKTGKPDVKEPEEIIPETTPESTQDASKQPETDGPGEGPESSEAPAKNEKGEKMISQKQCVFISDLLQHWKDDGAMKDRMLKKYAVKLFNDLTLNQAREIIETLKTAIDKDHAKEKADKEKAGKNGK
jgi:hypothetical protein